MKTKQPIHLGNPLARTPWVRGGGDYWLALWLWKPVAVPYLPLPSLDAFVS